MTRHDAHRVLGHSLESEVYRRPTVQRETPADFWRAFLTFAALIVALYALVLIGAAVELSKAVAP